MLRRIYLESVLKLQKNLDVNPSSESGWQPRGTADAMERSRKAAVTILEKGEGGMEIVQDPQTGEYLPKL